MKLKGRFVFGCEIKEINKFVKIEFQSFLPGN